MHPLETRDVSAASIIRECTARGNGVPTPGGGYGVWLDTPMIEMIHGEGTIEKRIPAMLRMYMNYGIDMRKVPILIYRPCIIRMAVWRSAQTAQPSTSRTCW